MLETLFLCNVLFYCYLPDILRHPIDLDEPSEAAELILQCEK